MSRPENELEVDHAALAADAAAVPLPENLDAPGAAAEAGGDAPGADMAPPASWAPLTPGLVSAVDLFVCPNWDLQDAEKLELAAALAAVLDQVFPGGLGDERWAPYLRLLIIAGGIVAARYDPDAGRISPLRKKKPAQDGAADSSAAGVPGGKGAQPAGSFTTTPSAGPSP